MRQLLFEEWKNTKISETTNGTIPNANSSQSVGVLNSFHVIEVLKYSNVAVSSHSQLRKFNENDNFDGDDAEEVGGDWGGGFNFSGKTAGKTKYGQAKSSRCWELICSDGKSTIYATELESLHIELSEVPGLKLLLKPPILTAKGVLLLKNSNVTVIGGRIKQEPIKSILLAHLESRYIASGGTPPERKKTDQSKLKALTVDETKQKKPTNQKSNTVNSTLKKPVQPKTEVFPVTKTTSNSDIRSFFAKKETVMSKTETNSKAEDNNSDFESDDDDYYAALAAANVKKAENLAQNQTKNDDQNTMKDDDEWSDDDDSLFIEAIKSATTSTSKSVSKSPERTATSVPSFDDSVIILDSPPPPKKTIKAMNTSTKNKKSSDWNFLCTINSFPSRNRIIIQGFIVTLAGKIQLNQAGITVKGKLLLAPPNGHHRRVDTLAIMII